LLSAATEVIYVFDATDHQNHQANRRRLLCRSHAECQDLLKRIGSRLEQHKQDQAQEPANWGYPGDLGRVTEELAYVLASLGDRSAVDAKGLEY
jgi:hypothetical protein